MAYPQFLTYADCIQHAANFLGGNATASGQADIRRAITAAYRDVTAARRWTYLNKFTRIRVQAPYATGTVVYDHTGGSSERLLTLSGGTFPTWVGATATTPSNATVLIAGKLHKVSFRLTGTTLQLDSDINPGDDISSTAYSIFLSLYSLPTDYNSFNMPFEGDPSRFGRYVRPNEWLSRERFGEGTGAPTAFTVMGDPNNLGRMAIHTLFVPSVTEELDFVYYRRPREFVLDGYKSAHITGTVATTASSATVTGTGTAFNAAMPGSIIRIGDTLTVPTGNDGLTPYKEQGVIASYSSATSIALAVAATYSQSGVAFIISDPVDIDPTMIDCFLRGIEAKLAMLKNMRNKDEHLQLYQLSFTQASQIDGSRVYEPREPGDGTSLGTRDPDAMPPDRAV